MNVPSEATGVAEFGEQHRTSTHSDQSATIRAGSRLGSSQASQNPARGPQFPIWVPSNPERGPVKSRAGSRQIPSGVPSNSERGPVKFRAGSENFRTGPCQNPPPHKENSGNSRGIFRPGASFFRLKFPFPVFSALLYPPLEIPQVPTTS